MRTTIWQLSAVALLGLAACERAADAPAVPPEADPDVTVAGTGVPAGYVAVTDQPDAAITDAKYAVDGGRWVVTTGPAHITYAAGDTASGVYGATATFDQLQAPQHPEAFGIFFGGQNLEDRAQQRYGYFLVRGTGDYLVKVREGGETRDVIDWTASPDVPTQDAAGKATYKLTVHAAPDTVHFMVNDKLVAAVPRSQLPTEGVVGQRINHNLNVQVTPVSISR